MNLLLKKPYFYFYFFYYYYLLTFVLANKYHTPHWIYLILQTHVKQIWPPMRISSMKTSISNIAKTMTDNTTKYRTSNCFYASHCYHTLIIFPLNLLLNVFTVQKCIIFQYCYSPNWSNFTFQGLQSCKPPSVGRRNVHLLSCYFWTKSISHGGTFVHSWPQMISQYK